MDYRLTLANLPTTVRGFAYIELDGVPRIVLNANLTREMNLRTMQHEIHHIESGELEDMSFDEYRQEE